MVSFKRLMCAVRGHEDYLHFEKNRVYLECVACGYESPGWTIETGQPLVRFQSKMRDDSRFSTARNARPARALIRKLA